VPFTDQKGKTEIKMMDFCLEATMEGSSEDDLERHDAWLCI